MKFRYSKRFKRRYKKLDAPTRDIVDRTIVLLMKDFTHPSLRNKNVQGYPGIREISGNMNIRLTFEVEKPDTIVFRNCGDHDNVLRNP